MQLKQVFRILVASALSLVAVNAFAVNYVSGTIQEMYFSGEANFAVRVYLNGVTDPCGNGGSGFAFINADASNYKVYVAALLAAKASGNSVTLTVTPYAYANSFCQLIEFSVGS